ncbi:MAG: hypothetical protein HYX68_14030 [Planctomycetes bacterium]|nr:hypothetical protein [Planctomycetota bacterium]
MKPAAIRAALARRGVEVEINLIKVVRHHWRVKKNAKKNMKAREKGRPRDKEVALDLPVGGGGSKKRKAKKEPAVVPLPRKSDAEIDAEVETLLNRISEE